MTVSIYVYVCVCVCVYLVLAEALSSLITQNIFPGSNPQMRTVDGASVCLDDTARFQLVASFQFMTCFRTPAISVLRKILQILTKTKNLEKL
uniref:Uncharacterized protein n=1 Tax=Octopus bimaculoides TaxID=37653 RepID=A0A0L8FHR8_OCTBM